MLTFVHIGTVGVFDGWSSYGTSTLERGRTDRECEEAAVDNRRPLIFDEGEPFTLRVSERIPDWMNWMDLGRQKRNYKISWLSKYTTTKEVVPWKLD